MKYTLVLLVVLMLVGCVETKANFSTSQRFEMTYIQGSSGAKGIVTDRETGCKYIYYHQMITPLYKNSKEVDCDEGNAE